MRQQLTDAESLAVAEYLRAKPVTVCPPMAAWGRFVIQSRAVALWGRRNPRYYH